MASHLASQFVTLVATHSDQEKEQPKLLARVKI